VLASNGCSALRSVAAAVAALGLQIPSEFEAAKVFATALGYKDARLCCIGCGCMDLLLPYACQSLLVVATVVAHSGGMVQSTG